MSPASPSPDPLHVAIIMDGNGRWATERGWPRLFGHRRGAERVREVVAACPDLGVTHLTVYAFSTENWKRSTEEVLGLMSLFARYIRREADKMRDAGVRVRFIGDRRPLDSRLQRLMSRIERLTAPNVRLHLTVAINYGGRGEISASAIDETTVCDRIDTAGLPDPDLVIRTSGEMRVSNYLLWQTAYAEFEFTPTLWPDFSAEELAAILRRFAGRNRRFGSAP